MSVRRVLAPLVLIVAAMWPSAAPVAAQADPPPPGECPDTMPYGDVQTGDTGVAWTVVRGTEPRPFNVEVIGKYDNGVLPDHDVILIRVSDYPGHQFIENNRGIWAGMSGSPVYIDDKLIGAVAYGYSWGPTTLGGVTPIGEMRAVDDLEPARATRLSQRLRAAVERKGPAAASASDFGRLPIPVVIPQGPTRGFRNAPPKRQKAMLQRFDVADRLEARGVKLIPMKGGRSIARSATTSVKPAASSLVPGGNFAASLSYGTYDAFGLGTTTWICGDRVLAFGHPMFFTGASNLGAHDGESFDIVDDLAFGTYKLGVATDLVGKVAQDRVTAIAARTNRLPDVTRLTTVATQGSKTRNGESFIAVRTPPFFAWIMPADHVYYELLSLVDASEDGSVGISLHVKGKRKDGSPFQLRFGDRWIGADRRGEDFFDAADAGGFGTGLMLSWLVESGLEKVTLDEVDVDLDVATADRWLIDGSSVSRNGSPYSGGNTVCVERGDDLVVRLRLKSVPGDEVVHRTVAITVPRHFDRLIIRGGRGLPPFLDPAEQGDFDSLLAFLRRSDRSDEVSAKIVSDGVKQASGKTLLKRVIVGSETITLREEGSQGC